MDPKLLVLPISRYVSGDYVTTDMRSSWARGAKHVVQDATGRRELAEGEPLGGAAAPGRRRAALASLERALLAVPAAARAPLWDERDDGEAVCFDAPRAAYEALVGEASREAPAAGSLFDRLAARVRPRPAPHLPAVLFLPAPFDPPFTLREPLVRLTGSAPRALAELDRGAFSELARPAAETLRAALDACVRQKLPLFVDW